MSTAGSRFRAALAAEQPLQTIGALNANHTLPAKRAGLRTTYPSGGSVAAGLPGLPALGIAPLDDMFADIRRITGVCDAPLPADIGAGFGLSAFNAARTTKRLARFDALCQKNET